MLFDDCKHITKESEKYYHFPMIRGCCPRDSFAFSRFDVMVKQTLLIYDLRDECQEMPHGKVNLGICSKRKRTH